MRIDLARTGIRTLDPGLGTPDYESYEGVLSADHHQAIVEFNEKHFGTTNQTLSMLRQPTDNAKSTDHMPEVVIPVVSCVVVIFLLGVFACLYRRRRKLLYVKGKKDSILRNNDGAILLENMNTMTKNPTYFYHGAEGGRHFNTRIIPTDHIRLGEVVGEGAFGQVFKGEMASEEGDTKIQVAVKILKDGASHEAQEDFEREVEIMSAFDHDNILKLLGVAMPGAEGNPCMIFEFMEHGDLTELLRRNDPYQQHVSSATLAGAGTGSRNSTAASSATGRVALMLNKADLVDISVQIASGMSYLASQHFVHRDLATRNCLVGSGLVVKISDFGMSRDIYTNDYYRIGGSRMLPVRWMSPEAIKYGRFTCESDIWAFGVVLWEIFSFGKQPYYGHSNEEVIHFLDQGILLQRPEDCPSTVYHVMIGCWKRDPRQRIVFERLVKYLSEYRNRLINNQRQQQQQQQQQQRQQEQQQKIDSSLNVNIEGSSSSPTTELTETMESQIEPTTRFTSIGAKVPGVVESITIQNDYRHGEEFRLQSVGDVNRVSHDSTLTFHTGTKSDATLDSIHAQPSSFPKIAIPSSSCQHHSSLVVLDSEKCSKPKPNSNSTRRSSSPRVFRTFSSKKGKSSVTYSALVANDPQADFQNDCGCAKTRGRRYSSDESSGIRVSSNCRCTGLLGCSVSESPAASNDQLTSSAKNVGTARKKESVKGGLLMDRLNIGRRRSSSALNSYEPSLLRASSFKALETPTNQRSRHLNPGESNNDRLQIPASTASRSTGVRLEPVDSDGPLLRRAQSQKEPLISNTSPTAKLR
ncbi:trk-like receptor tyrosine kinase [Plakobranchus ocellatus]|uniref:Tyrosine-protein kinase receptor n=1 Tax=Plakobranchus ocellatus TaxID=259542 RepID=A0AAV4AGI0_9GAST|nr:trk-like receptor tyrosine kinase [Plakobranchus ocellatus]